LFHISPLLLSGCSGEFFQRVTSLAKKPIQFLNRKQQMAKATIGFKQTALDEAVHRRHRQPAEIVTGLSEF